MSDENYNEREVKTTRTLKLGAGLKQSRFQADLQAKQNQVRIQEEFEKKADNFINNHLSYQENGANIAKKFIGAIRDKTLNNNKGVLSKELEREIREDLLNLIRSMNMDPDQEDDQGTVSGMALMIKAIFELRDRVNELEFENLQLKSKLS